jgi:flagella basal body P-ring formation protein FlgA
MKSKPRKTVAAWTLVPLMAVSASLHAATPQEQMHAALTDWVGAQNGVPASQVQVMPLDARVAVQPCAAGFSFDYPFVNRENVRVRCLKPNWQLFVKVGFTGNASQPAAAATVKAQQAAEIRQVVVAATNLSAGQILQRESLKLERLDAEKVSSTHYLDPNGLEGQEVVRAVRAGDPIRLSDLRPAVLIRRGEQVMLTVGSPQTFEISVKAEAMQDGKMGEQIKLRNLESGRTLSGVVSGKGTAKGL